ncbi:hypothetical protein MHBO_000053 [Bonamia ostreae]|uniref:RNA helicase n=1 Tax=Bonamia ostreae TaxID=126728 RepID=A0ABV2AF74_9EUKA
MQQIKRRLSTIQMQNKKKFSDFELEDDIQKFLKSVNIKYPTNVQTKVLDLLLRGEDVVFADQTGTGKTFSTIIYSVQRIKNILSERESHILKPGAPLAIIVSPTRELATQILKTAKQISHVARFSSSLLTQSGKIRNQKEELRKGPHLVVGTPGTLIKHIKLKSLDLSEVRFFAFDEVDVLFDKGFVEESRRLKKEAENNFKEDPPFHSTQFCGCSSTIITRNLTYLQRQFPFAYPVVTKMHQVPPKEIKVKFIELGGRDKMQTLHIEIEEMSRKNKKMPMTLIFCNSEKSCAAVKNFLAANSFDVVEMHNGLKQIVNFCTFQDRKNNYETWKSKGCQILVATDIACRGLDTDCEHVFLFDFPVTTTEYLNRIGRTARLGKPGDVTALLNKSDVPFAKRIEVCFVTQNSIVIEPANH